ARTRLPNMEDDVTVSVAELGRRARVAAADLAVRTRANKDAALLAMAEAPEANAGSIVTANADDVARARSAGTSEAIIDRLRLDEARVGAMADGLRQVAGLPDPVGEVVRGYALPNGLQVSQRRVPFGVVGIIYEARPNGTDDAAALKRTKGNCVPLCRECNACATHAASSDEPA